MYYLRGYPGQSEQVTGNGGGKGRKGQEAGSNNNNRHPTNQRESMYLGGTLLSVCGGDARADCESKMCDPPTHDRWCILSRACTPRSERIAENRPAPWPFPLPLFPHSTCRLSCSKDNSSSRHEEESRYHSNPMSASYCERWGVR